MTLHRNAACMAFLFLFVLVGCGSNQSEKKQVRWQGNNSGQVGMASWYGGKFHGRQTASGEVFDKHKLTAAHKTLPFGTRLRVTNLENGRSVTVKVNDRGPFVKGRVLDLSRGAAEQLRMIEAGVVRVRMERIQ